MALRATGAIAFAVLLTIATIALALAQDRSAQTGMAIAATWCANCHAIGDSTQAAALVDAPAFEHLAAQEGFGIDTVRRALLEPHPVMPEFPVSNDDIVALTAYIETLAPPAN